VNPAELQKKVRAGLERLYDYQHASGGWGWWKTDEDNVFMTAYVLAGLGQAREAGYEVRSDAMDSARNWLRVAVLGDKKLAGDLTAYVAYAFAASGTPDAGIVEAAWRQRTSLTPYGLAVLGLAMKAGDDARATEVAAELENLAKMSESEVWWESHYDWLLDFSGDDSAEATALALKLLAEVNPDSLLLSRAAQYLVNHRDEGSYWTSTKQTAMIVYGLTDYMKQSGELAGDFNAQVFVGSRQVLSKHFTAADAMLPPVTARIPESQLAAGANTVRVVKSGAGRLYWAARGDSYSADKRLTNNGNLQLTAVREYFRLTPIRRGDQIIYKLDSMPETVSTGDVIAVRITVAGSDWRYLMVEDPIPAGTEAIARDDLYQLDSKPSWWESWFTQRELHDDRTTFFQRWFSHGQHEFVYLLKVVNPGQFKVSPTRVEPMYQPQYVATTDAKVVTVK
jgi:alpha-2-macroglobulin